MSTRWAFWNSGFWRWLFNREPSRQEPGSIPDQPPVTPPVVVPPVVVPPVVTPPVVTPPVVTPPAARPNPCAGGLHSFCESYDGKRSDSQLAKIGWPVDKTFIHVWDTGNSQPVWSAKGLRVLNIKNPAYRGTNLWDTYPKDWKAAITGYIGRARAGGCVAVSVDTENWLLQAGPPFHEFLYQSAKAAGLMVFNVPRIGLRHFFKNKEADGWAWSDMTSRPGRLFWTQKQVCDFWNRNSDLEVAWDYGTDPQAFINETTYLTGLGYTVPSVPMMDGAGRDNVQRIPDASAAAMVVPLWLRYGTIGIFNAHNLGPKFVGALRSVRP